MRASDEGNVQISCFDLASPGSALSKAASLSRQQPIYGFPEFAADCQKDRCTCFLFSPLQGGQMSLGYTNTPGKFSLCQIKSSQLSNSASHRSPIEVAFNSKSI